MSFNRTKTLRVPAQLSRRTRYEQFRLRFKLPTLLQLLRAAKSGVIAVALLAASGPATNSADWPCWRGPDRNGIAPAAELSLPWPESGPSVLWTADVGTGFSSLAVVEGRVFTLGNTADIDTVWCLDAATGDVLWQASYPAPLDPNLFDGGPTATPTVDGGQVFIFSRTGLVCCFNVTTGEEQWRRNVAESCRVNVPSWGFSGSPLVEEGRVYLTAGSAGIALDRRTGDVLWKSDNSDDAGYATPVLTSIDSQPTLLVMSGKALHAVDPASGTQRWEHRWITRYGVNAADPLVQGDQIFLSSGYAKGSSMLQAGATMVSEVWRNRDLRNQMCPGVLIEGHVYAVDGDAGEDCLLKCVELATGAVRWEQPNLGSATLIGCGDKLLILSDSGELLIADASPAEFRAVARAKVLAGKCWTAPALAEARLYCRNAAGNVVCLDLRPTK